MGPDAVAIVLGGHVVTRSNDTEYPFRQHSDFWYLTGFDHPDAVAVLHSGDGPDYTLFVQPREREAETWTGYRPGVEGALHDFGADEAHPIGKFFEKLPDIICGAKRIHHELGRDARFDQKLVEALNDLRRKSRLGHDPVSEIVDLRTIVHEMRLYKEPEEIGILRRAADITREAHRRAAALAHEGRYEYELAAELDYTFRRLGGSGPAYSSIVGGGANAATLHYVRNDQPLRDGELILIDAGTELAGYASDVTRTYPVGGKFLGARKAAYEVVLAAQLAALAECKPGATLELIHDTTVRQLVEGMVELGLLQGNAGDLIATDAYKPYYMHRTSHWIGLDVHDAGAYSQAGSPRKLEPGMVFSVEPGLYVAPDAEGIASELRGLGVRLEDDVLITESGHENLNAAIPKSLDEIEAWVGTGE